MQRKVGEVFECNGVMLRVEKNMPGDESCEGCFFDKNGICSDEGQQSRILIAGHCSRDCRESGDDVIFVEVESGFHSMIGNVIDTIEKPMFSKRETLVLEFAKAIILSPGRIIGSQTADNYIKTAVTFADQFLSQTEQSK